MEQLGPLSLIGFLFIATPPPERYDFPYKGELTIVRVHRLEANRLCDSQRTTVFGNVGACAILHSASRCTIIINVDSVMTETSLLRHEVAHCNGWPGHHPR